MRCEVRRKREEKWREDEWRGVGARSEGASCWFVALLARATLLDGLILAAGKASRGQTMRMRRTAPFILARPTLSAALGSAARISRAQPSEAGSGT